MWNLPCLGEGLTFPRRGEKVKAGAYEFWWYHVACVFEFNTLPSQDRPFECTPHIVTLEAALKAFGAPHVPRADKYNFPLICPAKLKDHHRCDASVEAVTLVMLDFDHLSPERAGAVIREIRGSGLAYAIYSSHSYRPPLDVRFRVVLFPSRPMLPDEFRRVWALLRTNWPELDPKCKDLSRSYFLPECLPDVQPFSWTSSGNLLDVEACLNTHQNSAPSSPATSPTEGPVRISDAAFTRAAKRFARGTSRTAHAWECVLRGVGFAAEGERDSTLFAMVNELARDMPTAAPASVARFFESSLSHMALEASGAPTTADVEYKFARAVEHAAAEDRGPDLIRNVSGTPIASEENILRALRGDAALRALYAYDEFACRIRITRPAPWGAQGELRDADVTQLVAYLMAKYRLKVGGAAVLTCVDVVAREHAYHPVREYLQGLTWDRTPRLDSWLQRHMHAADSPVIRQAGAWFLIQAVNRVLKPGCKADYVLALFGKQGAKKSSTVSALASPAWFADSVGDLANKDSALALQGKWVVELPELAATRRSDVETAKAFLTRPTDRVRVPYGRLAEDFPRQCVFVGTSNDDTPLTDPTGNRRYWPVKVEGEIDLDAIARERDQLWAEAYARAVAGERCWPEGGEVAEHAREVAEHETPDAFEDDLAAWLEEPVYRGQRLTTRFFANLVGLDRMSRGDELRLGTCLRRLGFTRDARKRVWVSPFPLPEAKLKAA